MSYKISLAGQKEALWVDDRTGEKLKDAWLNNTLNDKFELKGAVYLASSIRAIEYTKAGMERPMYEGNKHHWIITNGKVIWKKSYMSYEDAKAEFDFQFGSLPPEVKQGWEIEVCGEQKPETKVLSDEQSRKIEAIKSEISSKWSVRNMKV